LRSRGNACHPAADHPTADQRGQEREQPASQQASKLIDLLKSSQGDHGITLSAFGKLAAKKKVAGGDAAIKFLAVVYKIGG
jgi:hypothetical protein